MTQQMTNIQDVQVGATIYKEGVFWTVKELHGPSTDGQYVIVADLSDTSDLSSKHIPEGYLKDMHFGGCAGSQFSVALA
jgi:hypothetical protein